MGCFEGIQGARCICVYLYVYLLSVRHGCRRRGLTLLWWHERRLAESSRGNFLHLMSVGAI